MRERYTLWDKSWKSNVLWLLWYSVIAVLMLTLFQNVGLCEIDTGIIAQIESSRNPGAIGDHGKALGMYQIHKAVVEDYNKYRNKTRFKPFSWSEMANPEKGEIVARWYLSQRIPALLRYYGLPVSQDNVLTAWNAGIEKVRKGYVAQAYIAKYRRISNA